MAVKVTVLNGEKRLLPTTEEIGAKLDDELVNYARRSHIEVHANDVTYGHVLLNETTLPLPAATEASVGQTGKAADAGHVHRLPTLAELSAAPASHQEVEATPEVLGHIHLVSDLSSTDPLTAIQVKVVNDRINAVKAELDAAIIQLQGGIQFYGSYYFGKTSPLTDLTDARFSPKQLSRRAGFDVDSVGAADRVVSIFDFTADQFCFYTAPSNAENWGEKQSILEDGKTKPNNGTQIGVSCFFVDIAQNTDAQYLSGHANWSAKKNKWDIYPDRVSAIDNVTITLNGLGQRRVAPYAATDRTPDSLDFEGENVSSQERTLHEWINAFFRKIRGLRKDHTELVELEKADKAELIDMFADNPSTYCIFEEQELTEADWAAEATV
ncbi:MAG: hypothetical protein NC218_01290 [Acetobacter sp.]|nr:hypothetical protein [Acetobacter sp.]